ARAKQRLHRLVRCLRAPAGPRGKPGGRRLSAVLRLVARSDRLGTECGYVVLRSFSRRYLVQPRAAGDGGTGAGPAGTGAVDRHCQLCGLGRSVGVRGLALRRCLMAKRSIEPFLWLLFSAGGVLSALLTPILALLFGLAFPLRWLQPPTHT